MEVIIEGLGLCLALYLLCLSGIRNGTVNMVHLYGKDVQNRVIELGMTTQEKINNAVKKFKTIGLVTYFGYTAICVFIINGTRGFIPSFLQFTGIFLIMGIFDRIVVDVIWVGYTKAWIIPGTEDLMPYIPLKIHLMKWIVTLVVYPMVALLICFLVSLFLK